MCADADTVRETQPQAVVPPFRRGISNGLFYSVPLIARPSNVGHSHILILNNLRAFSKVCWPTASTGSFFIPAIFWTTYCTYNGSFLLAPNGGGAREGAAGSVSNFSKGVFFAPSASLP